MEQIKSGQTTAKLACLGSCSFTSHGRAMAYFEVGTVVVSRKIAQVIYSYAHT